MQDEVEEDRGADAPRPLRIDAPPAGVVAGVETAPVPTVSAPPAAPAPPPEPPEATAADERPEVQIPDEAFDLPNWSDPPTGAVPRVLLDQSASDEVGPSEFRGPTWRQEDEGFAEETDLSFLLADDGLDESIAGNAEPPAEAPFEFRFAGDPVPEGAAAAPADDEAAWTPQFNEPPRRAGSPAHRRRASQRSAQRTVVPRRNALVATLTGLVLAAVAIGCFALGSVTTVALVAIGTTIAAGELFGVLQRVGYRPATLVGLASVPALVLVGYLTGTTGVVEATGVIFLVSGAWFLLGRSGDEPLVNLAVTALAIVWIGITGACGGLLLAPMTNPHRHGVAYILAVMLLVAVDDIGAYAVGSKLGRHKLAPAISPGKSVEGLIGGSVVCLVVAAAVVSRIHPLSLSSALELAGVVLVLAPLGDLLESRVKRDLGVKDMGTLLPSHGGLLDRIDAMLFVLPGAYVLFTALHLG